MLFQLGNKQYDGLFAPESWSYSGNEANLAQYPLINTKPRLQNTGETLEELTFSFQLRVEFCNPAQEIDDLEQWKKDGEILPLLLGNGQYRGDYVIRSVDKEIVQTFNDGTIIEAQITLNLLEHVPDSAEEQQAATDRRNAAAVGDKKQIVRRPAQKPTSEAEAHAALMLAQNKAWEASEAAQKAMEAQSPESKITDVKRAISSAQDAMDAARQKVSDAQEQINNATGIISAVENAKDRLTEIGNLMQPPISLTALNDSILNLQTGIRGIDTNSTVFTENIILRRQ